MPVQQVFGKVADVFSSRDLHIAPSRYGQKINGLAIAEQDRSLAQYPAKPAGDADSSVGTRKGKRAESSATGTAAALSTQRKQTQPGVARPPDRGRTAWPRNQTRRMNARHSGQLTNAGEAWK